MARAGMATLISDMRGQCAAGTADYTLAGVTYWTDDQLQAELDKTRREWKSRALIPDPVNVNGVSEYYDYTFPLEVGGWVEESASGSSVWAVKDSNGATVGTANYSVNYRARVVTFTTNTTGFSYYLDCHGYNLPQAAANVWRWKAAHVADQVNWQSDNHRFDASQERAACLEMASSLERQGAARSVRVGRRDLW